MIYVIGLCSFLLAFLLPGHFLPWTTFQQELFAACGAAFTALAAAVTVREWPVRVPAPAWAAIFLALVAMLQWTVGLVPYLSDALLPAMYLAAFALTIVTGFQLARGSQRFVGALFGMFCAAALASTGLALAQWFDLGPYAFLEGLDPGGRMYANLKQPNHLASLLGLGVASLWWAYESRRVGGVVACLALGLLAWGMVMTQSRVAWLCAILFALLYVVYRRRLALRTTPAATAGVSAAFIAMIAAWGTLNAWVQFGSGGMTLVIREPTPGLRLIHWQTLIDALLRSPWTGYGWLQVPRAQLATVLDHPVTFEQLGSSHNQILDLLVWTGLPLGLLVVGVIVWWAVSRLRSCANIESWAVIAALGVLFAHSMVEFPLQYAYFLLPAGLIVGALEARLPPPPTPVLPSIGRGAYSVVALALVTLLAIVVNEYSEVEEQVRRVRLRELRVIESVGYEAAVPPVVLLDAPREYVRLWLTEQSPGMSVAELDWLRIVSERYPTPAALTRYAVASGLNGRADEADRSLRILCRVHPPPHCDQTRTRWATLAGQSPALAAVTYPETPSR